MLHNTCRFPFDHKNCGRASIPLIGGVLVAATLALVVWVTNSDDHPIPDSTTVTESVEPTTPVTEQPASSDIVPVVAMSDSSSQQAQESMSVSSPDTELSLSADAIAADQAGLSEQELMEIGTAGYSDGEFELLQQLIADNPVVLGQLMELYRANTDPDRAKRLAELLGRFDDPGITELGTELVFSGDPASQQFGLRLLGRQQQRSPEARKVVQQVLEVETDPGLLVSALNAVAVPSAVNTDERRQMLDQLTMLSEHTDPAVRSHSFTLIKNWSKNVNMNDTLLRGLADGDSGVRESATFALLNTRHTTDAVKYALLQRIEDSSETKRIREGALYALTRFNLTDEEKRRYGDAKRVVNRLR